LEIFRAWIVPPSWIGLEMDSITLTIEKLGFHPMSR